MFRRLALLACALALLSACRREPPAPAGPVEPGTLKIEVAQDGLYRLTATEIARALGHDSLDASSISRLTMNGRPVAFTIRDAADGDASEGEIVFYGLAPDDRYTDRRAYLLEVGQPAGESSAPGPLMAGPLADQPSSARPAAATIPVLARFEENRLYKSSAFRAADGQSPWFWDTIQVQSRLDVAFDLPGATGEEGELRLQLWGATSDATLPVDHDLDVLVNDQPVGLVQWDGEARHEASLRLPAGILRAGANTLTLDNTADGATFLDIMLLDSFTVAFRAEPVAVDDRLELAPGASGSFSLHGFTSEPLAVDVADPSAPVILPLERDDGAWRLVVNPEQRVVLAGRDGLLPPLAVAPLRSTSWKETAVGADLVVITTDTLAPSLDPLVAARQAQGLRVAVVPTAEIYDQFGHGQSSPEAIVAFLRHAAANWSPPAPRYVLLVGEATYDYKDYLGRMPAEIVPTLLVPVAYSGETVSDARLADVDADGRPDMAVGRWPVASVAAAEALTRRTLAYEDEEAPPLALFTADGTSAEFSSFSDRLIEQTHFPGDAVLRLYGAPEAEVLPAWNAGAWLVAYTGHGSTDMWGRDDVLSAAAVSRLAGAEAAPIVVQFTCLTGFFAHPEIESLSETLLLQEDGPVLLVAATSLTLSSSQEPFAAALLNALRSPTVSRMGDAMQLAKADLNVAVDNLREISDTFGLLGDPSALIRRPAAGAGG